MWEADGQQLSAHTCLYTIGVTSQPIKRWGYKQATIQVITLQYAVKRSPNGLLITHFRKSRKKVGLNAKKAI